MEFTGVIAGGGGGLTLDAGYIVSRVANMLERSDLDNEIMHWLNMAQWELADRVRFPELRTDAPVIAVVADQFIYGLPSDFGNIDRVFYKATYAIPAWGHNLQPSPETHYNEPVDWQRSLDVDAGARKRGDPRGFLVQHATLILDASPLATGIPAELHVSYFRTPLDLMGQTDVPEVEKRWRLYLIPLTLYWGKILTEKSADAISTIAFWEKKKAQIIDKVTNAVHATENKILRLDPPAGGTEDADELY